MRESLQESRTSPGWAFSQCLVEGDEAAMTRSRRIRRRSLLAALALQSALLAALVLVPLFATGSRLVHFQMTPLPPYRGSPRANPEARQGKAGPRPAQDRPVRPDTRIYEPPRIPDTVATGDKANPNEPWVGGIGHGTEPPGVPGGTEVVPVDRRWTPELSPAPKPPQGPRAVVSEGVQQALLVHRVEPVYPLLARQIHLEGTVQLHAIIGRDGTVRSLEVLNGHPILARAAREAVSEWRYRPTLLSGQPVEVETHITVIFQLRR